MKNEYLKPVTLSDRVWLYVEKNSLCIVVRHAEGNTQTFNTTWKRLDRLRKQAESAES